MQHQLQEVKEKIKSGAGVQQLMDECMVAFARYPKFCQQYAALQKPKIRDDLKVILLYGKPDAGKTYYAYNKYPDLYSIPVKSGSTLWFSGYDREKTVLIDDFAGEFRLTELLRLLDKYPIQVENKGGHCWFCPENIIITSNVSWEDWYDYGKRQDSKKALQRRISEFYYCTFENGYYRQQRTDHQFLPFATMAMIQPLADDPKSPNLISDSEDSDLELRASTSDWENIVLK